MSLCHARPPARWVLPGLAWLLLIACGKETREADQPAACHSDADCASAQRCEPLASPGERPMMVAPCMVTFAYCSTSANCSNGQVCWPLGRNGIGLPPNCHPTGSTCGPPCTTTNNACFADEVCEESGECRLPACDEASGMACPDHWRCDRAAAGAEPMQPVYGAHEADSQSYGRDITRGCARIRCDEAGGFTCKDGWVCDPASATDPSGCVALPCAEAGHCSDDARFICQPTSLAPRPMGGDAHGCVLRNCEEGFECHAMVNGVDVGYCDFEGPLVDAFGCAWRRCNEAGSACYTSQTCEPASSFADPRGCRPKTCAEGESCGTFLCDPSDPNADARGCVAPAGSGGAGGNGGGNGGSASGQAGTGATGQGGSSSGGSAGANGGSGGIKASGGNASGGSSGASASGGTPPDEMTGRCVDR